MRSSKPYSQSENISCRQGHAPVHGDSHTGRDEDKLNCYGIPAISGAVPGLPVIEERCLLPPTAAQEKYDTLFGEVVPLRQILGRLAMEAGISTTISSIRCIILAVEILWPAGVS